VGGNAVGVRVKTDKILERAFRLPGELQLLRLRPVGQPPRSLVETELNLRIVAVFDAILLDITAAEGCSSDRPSPFPPRA
jgi:hypothetical protein